MVFCAVILNEVKNLLKADKRQRARYVASKGILRCAQDDILRDRDYHAELQPSSQWRTH